MTAMTKTKIPAGAAIDAALQGLNLTAMLTVYRNDQWNPTGAARRGNRTVNIAPGSEAEKTLRHALGTSSPRQVTADQTSRVHASFIGVDMYGDPVYLVGRGPAAPMGRWVWEPSRGGWIDRHAA